ncbi:MAG: ABC transporter permease [Egibacteraceae bacterium]
MGRYILRRLLQMIPVLIGTTFLIYAMNFALPGDPVAALGGDRPLPQEVQEQIRDRYNLDDPLLVQYAKYMGNVVQGDFGESLSVRRGQDVTEIVADTWPVTVRLALVAFVFELIIGIAAGVVAALRRGSFLDNLVRGSTILLVSLPIFVTALVLQVAVGLRFEAIPVAGTQQGLVSYFLPGIALASVSLAYLARLTRNSLMENLRADYVRTATAKGLPRSRVVGRHALRNSMIPVVTFLAFDIGVLLSGTIVTEGIFNLNGIGGIVFDAIRQQDGTVVVGIVTMFVLIYLFANLVVDVLYAALDPRIRYE